MTKTQLKFFINECATEVLEEQRVRRSLQEDFNRDLRAMQKNRLLSEGLISSGLLTEAEVDEGFLDTAKNLGKNAITSLANSWKKAKAQGDDDEVKRLEKRISDIKGKQSQDKKSSDKEQSGGNKRPKHRQSLTNIPQRGGNAGKVTAGDEPATASAGSASGAGAATAPAGSASGAAPAAGASGGYKSPLGARGKKGKGAQTTHQDKQQLAKKATEEILAQIKKNDPKGFAQLQAVAEKGPEAIEKYIKAPSVQKVEKTVSAGITAEKPKDPEQQGFMGKAAAWMKKNPVKTGVGLALLAALGTAAAIGSGGIAPLAVAILKGTAMGAVKGGAVAGIGGAAVDTYKQAKEKGLSNVDLKQVGKAGLSAAGKGAVGGAIVGGISPFLSNAFAGMKHIQAIVAGHAGTTTPQELHKAAQISMSSQDDADKLVGRELSAKMKAMQGIRAPNGYIEDVDDNHFRITAPNGIHNYFYMTGRVITDAAELQKLEAIADAHGPGWHRAARGPQ